MPIYIQTQKNNIHTQKRKQNRFKHHTNKRRKRVGIMNTQAIIDIFGDSDEDEFVPDCHCDNGDNCVHFRSTQPVVYCTTDYSPTDYSLTDPVYSPTEPPAQKISPLHQQSKKTKRKHVVDLTEDDTPPLKVARTNSHSTSADFECPINCSFMKDPVVDILGHTYDRSALERWLKRKLVSPLTGENYVDVLRRRKMSNSRDTQSMIREKIIVATNYSMIQNSTWKLFKENA